MVVLVGDYLDRQLAQFNRMRVSDRRPWLPVQLSGIAPLIGPLFTSGKSACWACLAERMKGNRQVKAFLDRKSARCVVASPISTDMLGKSAVQLAALEIAKAIATGFRTDVRDHVISLDLLGSTIARHYVSARPQCPVCGSKELREPERPPRPVKLTVGGNVVMTSGGYRSVPPAVTVARFRKHVSPLTGVVSHLQRINSEFPSTPATSQGTISVRVRSRSTTQGRPHRRQLWQGQHRRAGRGERAHGSDRALLRNFSGR